jgi:hypothetical protein
MILQFRQIFLTEARTFINVLQIKQIAWSMTSGSISNFHFAVSATGFGP